MRFRQLMQDRNLDRRVHGTLTLVWFLLAIPAVLWWRHSVPFLVYVSVYANFVGHWSSYQAAKAERAIEDAVQETNGGPSGDSLSTTSPRSAQATVPVDAASATRSVGSPNV